MMCFALLIANTINIGADLSGMADAAELLTGIDSHLYVVCFGLLIAFATVRLRYATLANTLKWLALVLFAYVITALMVQPPWKQVMHDTFVPHVPERSAWGMIVAILGTTISPYLFFWQASQEVEEEKAIGRITIASSARRDAAGDVAAPVGYWRGNVRVDRRNVLHRADNSIDAAQERHHESHIQSRSRTGARASRRTFRKTAVCRRSGWHRCPRDSHTCRIRELCVQ